MLPNELFIHMTPETASQIFSFLYEKDKAVYKAIIDSLAKQRKLRPVFVERKPRAERFIWLKEALSRKASEGLAAQLLQLWLVNAHGQLLCDFLDGLGIEHDEKGTVNSLPPAPEKEKIAPVIETLLAKHDPVVVALYLNAFQALDENGGWPTLGELIASDPRIQLVAP